MSYSYPATKRISPYTHFSFGTRSASLRRRTVSEIKVSFILFALLFAFLFLYLYYSNQYVDHVYEIKKERQNLSHILEEHTTLGIDLMRTRSLTELEATSKNLGMMESRAVDYVLLSGERTLARE